MATYAIGDIQGCYQELCQLLALIQFDPAQDRLWFVGDLVNRGPQSLEVLRLLQSLGDCVVCVLGNHDLHLLAVAAGVGRLHPSDTLNAILQASDRDSLLNWLSHQKLAHIEDNYILVHAGVLPEWSASQLAELASEIETILRSKQQADFFKHMYGNQPNRWQNDLTGYDRFRLITNALTRMRICTTDGLLEFKFKGEYQDIPAEHLAWFELNNRATIQQTVIFGHWSALGLRIEPNLIALDTGCLWGGKLSAVRLQDRQLFQVNCMSKAAEAD